jgi:hypothetical protein
MLKSYELLSNFAFRFNVRHYSKAPDMIGRVKASWQENPLQALQAMQLIQLCQSPSL